MRNASPRTVAAPGKRPRERGQGLVELAFFLPLIAVLWLGLIDMARINRKKQAAYAALDALSQVIQNQNYQLDTTDDMKRLACNAFAETLADQDMGGAQGKKEKAQTEADCISGGWVTVQDTVADSASSEGGDVTPVSVTVPVPAIIVPTSGIRLAGGSQYRAGGTYYVTTGVHYVRSTRVVQ